jgi:hypothetical protein
MQRADYVAPNKSLRHALAWKPRGKRSRVPTPGTNQKKSVFGAPDVSMLASAMGL